MAKILNRVKVSTTTTGTGAITLGSPFVGCQSFADGGATNGDIVRYVIEDGDNWEIGEGTYSTAGPTITRTVLESSNAGSAISLTGSARVFSAFAVEDIPGTNPTFNSVTVATTLVASNISDGTTTVGTGYVVNGSAKMTHSYGFSGTTLTTITSFNVSSAVDNGAGDQTTNFTNNMSVANYPVTSERSIATGSVFTDGPPPSSLPATSNVRILTTFGTTGTAGDAGYIAVNAHGDLA